MLLTRPRGRSDKSRHAFSVHVIDGRPGCVYPADNWLQRPPENPFRELP
jgi:phytanoyl-CoA hydroxylase